MMLEVRDQLNYDRGVLVGRREGLAEGLEQGKAEGLTQGESRFAFCSRLCLQTAGATTLNASRPTLPCAASCTAAMELHRRSWVLRLV